jgi:hypothetical protein
MCHGAKAPAGATPLKKEEAGIVVYEIPFILVEAGFSLYINVDFT